MKYEAKRRADITSAGDHVFSATLERSTPVTTKRLVDEIAKISTVASPDVAAVLTALKEVIPQHLADGCIVYLEGIGSLRINMSAASQEFPVDVDASQIRGYRFLFSPAKELKETAISNITLEKNALSRDTSTWIRDIVIPTVLRNAGATDAQIGSETATLGDIAGATIADIRDGLAGYRITLLEAKYDTDLALLKIVDFAGLVETLVVGNAIEYLEKHV